MSYALIFDFDGTILDTETPAWDSMVEVWKSFGLELPLDWWLKGMGTNRKDSWIDELERILGKPLNRHELMARRQQTKDTLTESKKPLPGVTDLIDAAGDRGIQLAVASSSAHEWVDRHLKRLNLYGHFEHVVCRDDVHGVSKPAPDVFVKALELLGPNCTKAVAIEDSPNGVQAATDAGLDVVAVPNPLVKKLDFSLANLCLEHLTDVDPNQLLESLFEIPGINGPYDAR
ncbi:MAG: HAD-IA family hydrolase [Actinobacteria bacterium]|jgi:HAD superfamily hydrolase (TIGR01509 family)|nr:HAD-IA family hydrolase [Actinomycetota bacterium]